MKWELTKARDSEASEADQFHNAEPKLDSDRFLSLKTEIHRSLLDEINLANLEKLSREQIEEEVRQASPEEEPSQQDGSTFLITQV